MVGAGADAVGPRPHRPLEPGAGRCQRRRQPGLVAGAVGLRAAAGAGTAGQRHALRRAALPLQLQLPRRGQPSRGAGRGGGPPRPRGAGAHRPRRLLRRGALRRGGPGRRAPHRVRRRSCPSGSPSPRTAMPDPEGDHLLVLARGPGGLRPAGLARSAPPSSPAARRASRVYDGDRAGRRRHGDHWLVLTGCRKGTVPAALERRRPRGRGPRARPRWSPPSGATTWPSSCGTTATRSTRHRNDALAAAWPSEPASTSSPPPTPTTPHPSRRRLATALAAVRARRSLDELDGWLPACAGAHLRSGDEQARRFARWPGAVERAAELGRACAFDLHLVGAASARRSRAPTASPRWPTSVASPPRAPQRRYGSWGARAGARRLRARSSTSWR